MLSKIPESDDYWHLVIVLDMQKLFCHYHGNYENAFTAIAINFQAHFLSQVHKTKLMPDIKNLTQIHHLRLFSDIILGKAHLVHVN